MGFIVGALKSRNVAPSLQNVPIMFLLVSCTKQIKGTLRKYNEAMEYKIASILILLMGLIPAMIALNKGHGFWKWWVFGSILFIAALPMSILLKPIQRQETTQEANGMKKCLHCAETIRVEAVVCQFCGHNLSGPPGVAEPEEMTGVLRYFRMENIQIINLVLIAILAAILLLISVMGILMLSNINY